MITIKNRSKKKRTLKRTWDHETGELNYFFENEKGLGRYVGSSRRKHHKILQGVEVAELEPGEAIRVPCYLDNYHQSAMRSGEFRSHLQHRRYS